MQNGVPVAGERILWMLIATVVFVLINAFFVAAEFALVKVRSTRIDALVAATPEPLWSGRSSGT